MKELESLVTDFASLRAGDLVRMVCTVTGCRGVRHRGILVRHAPARMVLHLSKGGTRVENGGDSWVLGPTPRCSPFDFRVVSREAIAERRVYRISTGLEAESATQATRPRKVTT